MWKENLTISAIFVLVIGTKVNAFPSENRIVDGSIASEFQFPWHVLLFVDRPSEPIRYSGGSLISQNFVLTVAHYIKGAQIAQIQMGSINFSTPLISMESTTFFVHPDFNPITYASDIGLIQLPTNVQYSNNHRPIRLLGRSLVDVNSLYGKICDVSGFGVIREDSVYLSAELRFAQVSVTKDNACAPLLPSLQPTQMCVIGASTSPSSGSSCYGDTGGALVLNEGTAWTQVGLPAVYPTGCHANKPTIYNSIGFAIDWIASVTGIAVRP